MSYRAIKRARPPKRRKATEKKPKKMICIAPELLQGKRFSEIVDRLSQQSDRTKQEEYLYGYALLHTGKKWEALKVLWPLTTKWPMLQADCATILQDLCQDNHFLSSPSLSDNELKTLFL